MEREIHPRRVENFVEVVETLKIRGFSHLCRTYRLRL